MTRYACLFFFASCILAIGCSSTTTGSETDTGTGGTDSGLRADGSNVDTGTTPGTDSGTTPGTDSGTTTDTDSGTIPGTDSGTMPGTDAGGTTDVDAGSAGIACGSATCGSGEICCITRGSAGMMITQTCTLPSDCMGATLACDGPEDCAATEACCGSTTGPGGASTMCVDDSMCAFGRLCHADTDCNGTDTCCAFMGAMVCSPRCFP